MNGAQKLSTLILLVQYGSRAKPLHIGSTANLKLFHDRLVISMHKPILPSTTHKGGLSDFIPGTTSMIHMWPVTH